MDDEDSSPPAQTDIGPNAVADQARCEEKKLQSEAELVPPVHNKIGKLLEAAGAAAPTIPVRMLYAVPARKVVSTRDAQRRRPIARFNSSMCLLTRHTNRYL
jgi:hypothetical protein